MHRANSKHDSVDHSTACTHSYEAMVASYGLTTNQLCTVCNDDVLQSLAPRMNQWQSIDLKLDSEVMDAIDGESSTDEEGKCCKLLECWKEKYKHKATYERLVRSLMASNRADLAKSVCKACKRVVPRTSESCEVTK